MRGDPKKQKTCAGCGRSFISRNKNSLYCSAACKAAEQERQRVEWARRRQNTAFVPVFEYIDRIYKETGVYLSYGKAVVRMQAERDAGERKGKKEQTGAENERVYAKRKE